MATSIPFGAHLALGSKNGSKLIWGRNTIWQKWSWFVSATTLIVNWLNLYFTIYFLWTPFLFLQVRLNCCSTRFLAYRVRIGNIATGPANMLMEVTANTICADMPTTSYSIPKNFVFNCNRYFWLCLNVALKKLKAPGIFTGAVRILKMCYKAPKAIAPFAPIIIHYRVLTGRSFRKYNTFPAMIRPLRKFHSEPFHPLQKSC